MPNRVADIVLVGVEDGLSQVVRELSKGAELRPHPYNDAILEAPLEQVPSVLICGAPPEGLAVAEVAQTLRMHYPSHAIFYLTNERKDFQRAVYQKNGFTDAFLIPNDRTTLRDELQRQISLASDGAIKAFRPVQLVDISPDNVLGFDLYLHLPANNRKIKYVGKADALNAEKAAKLQKHKIQSAMVTEDQMQQFYQFTARSLKNLGNGLSATEARAKRERAVRDLFSGIFSDGGQSDTIASGRQLMTDCQQIVKSYIVDDSSGKNSWYEKLLKTSSSGDTPYDHAANVATFAALLSIGLGIGDPTEIALAGILHDIGLADLDPAIVAKDPKDRTRDEQKAYEQHPLRSISIIRERKIIVSEKVIKIIEQHHESYAGGGYPNNIPPQRMLPEAQVLAIADELDELTATIDGKIRLSMQDAVTRICQTGINNPTGSQINPIILGKVSSLFVNAA